MSIGDTACLFMDIFELLLSVHVKFSDFLAERRRDSL